MTRIVAVTPEKIIIEFEKRLELHDGHKFVRISLPNPLIYQRALEGK
ncbi:hypothetical protein ACQZ46_02400 [Agrobacterium salinitolerans]